jgi:hypothetical protein
VIRRSGRVDELDEGLLIHVCDGIVGVHEQVQVDEEFDKHGVCWDLYILV